MDELVLADIQALAASIDYGGRGHIQPSTAVLGLSAALFLSDLTVWRGAGYKLTDGEIDDIEAMIAQLEEDLMLTGDMYAMDKVQITADGAQSVPNAVTTAIDFDVENYDPQDMHDNVTNNNRIYVVRDGLHLINFNIAWEARAVGKRLMRVDKYDFDSDTWSLIAVTNALNVSGTSGLSQLIATQDEAIIGDFYSLSCYQDSGSPLDIQFSAYSPICSVVRL